MDINTYIKHIGSRSVYVLIGLLALIQFFHLSTFEKKDAVRHDMLAYYGYLPAFFIHGDLTLNSVPEAEEGYYTWTVPAENGRVFKMTMGVAIMNAPAFFIADTFARLGTENRTGHDSRYYFFVFLSAVFFFSRGLKYCYEIAVEFAGPVLSFIVVLIIGFGSNLMYYAFDEPMMSHVYSFFLYALLLRSTLNWVKTADWRSTWGIGLAIGLLTLIRPIHGIAALIPIIYTLSGRISLKGRWPQIFGAATLAVFCVVPQLLYWKVLSGEWLFYSYGEEGFFFSSPMILNGLLGFRKGWFIYTPVAFLILPGLYLLFRERRSLFLASTVFLSAYIYIVFSWWCWWYGGSFGSRPMVDILPICIPMIALAIDRFRLKARAPLAIPIALAFIFIFLNRFQSDQYRSSLLHWDGMNSELYQEIWLDKHFPKNYEELVQRPDYEAALKGERKP